MAGIFVPLRDDALRRDSETAGDPVKVILNLADSAHRRDRRPSLPAKGRQGGAELSRGSASLSAFSIGNLLYLSSVGLVAAGIIATFFGTGVSLLLHSPRGIIPGAATRPGPEGTLLQTFPGKDYGAPSTDSADNVQSSATLPAPAEAPTIAGGATLLNRANTAASPLPMPDHTSGDPAVVTPPPPIAVAATPPAQPTSALSATELSELLEHGDALLRTGDVASARLFYERAAGVGDGRAALRLGATFDPAFLGRLNLGKMQADVAEARLWYSRALDLGAVEAKRQLNSLDAKQGK